MIPYKISVLVFLRDNAGRLLLIQRSKAPNQGCWSPIGGKLEMGLGESPFECAIRETAEEVALAITEQDLHLFGYIAEKNYEGNGHWLMFLFDCAKILPALPATGDEGEFGFFTRAEIDHLHTPPTDQALVWKWYDQYRTGFVALRANCMTGEDLNLVVEQAMKG
ncbi:MAG TPA: NUDIX hydrolase [Opitutales bacterium]|jgi:8-oxo-dGTP diphosphatase|nr:NUDIX hydrolase [Opitutales bacterium]